MNIWIIILFIWTLIDFYRYVKYVIIYNKLNNVKGHNEKNNENVNHTNIKKFLNDLKSFPELIEENIKDIYYGKTKLENTSFEDVCDAIYTMCAETPMYIDHIKKIVKSYQISEKNNNRIIFKNTTLNHRINKNTQLKSWFLILPLFLIIKCFRFFIDAYMLFLGYKYQITNNGLKIWYTIYDETKGTPLVFFHASVGGFSFHYSSLRHYQKNYNIIMPEIPGISFTEHSDIPPSIDMIIDDVFSFVNNFIQINHNNKINLMGHSLGNSMCAAFINKYPTHVDNFFCIEGQIFFNRGLKIYADLESDVRDIPQEDILSIPLFHRNLYVQYYIIKQVTLDTCCIYDLVDPNNQHIKIHMFHTKMDNKILIMPQIEYANKKKIPIRYYIFEGNYSHGSFILNNTFKNYVTTKIKEICDKSIVLS